jgi:membrane-associated protease RseP (regulator of RpoE activity)
MRRNALIEGIDREARARRVAAGLFGATCCSVFVVRWLRWEQGPALDAGTLWNAWGFTAVLMGILLAHELAHYGVARAHGFRLSLPWFLPAPVLLGTLGAVIRLEDPPRTRAGLLEMGAAGPLGGMIVVVVAMAGRLWTGPLGEGGIELAPPLLWSVMSWSITGSVQPVDTADPVAFAAWTGCLLTAMNLLPLGQLDGGHVVGALTPRWAETVGWATTGGLLLAGLWWPGWAVWAGLLHLLGARTPLEPRRPEATLGTRPRLVAAAAIGAFGLAVVPVPF